jgi:DNA-binding transcriptional LysR family regulator
MPEKPPPHRPAEPPPGPPDSLERITRELDWNLLRTFMVIVQEGSITRAAGRLLLRQPSVSNALRRLESQLGRRLIDRGPGRFRITEHGALLYREALEIYGTVSRLAVVLREVREEVSGHVTLALASHVETPLLDDALAACATEHPRVTFTIDVMSSAAVVQAVLQRTASLGICLVHKPNPRLRHQHVYREHFGFFCGPRHRLFGRSGLTMADLRDEPLVSFKTDRTTDALRPVALLRAQEDFEDRIRATSTHLEEVRRMILIGLGIGPLPIHVVARDVQSGLLWQLPPYDSPPAIDVFLVTNPQAHLSRAERLLIDTLVARIEGTPERERIYPPFAR